MEERGAGVVGVELRGDLEGDAVEEPALEAEARAAEAEAGAIRGVARLQRGVRADVGDALHLHEHLGLDAQRAGVEAEVLLERRPAVGIVGVGIEHLGRALRPRMALHRRQHLG